MRARFNLKANLKSGARSESRRRSPPTLPMRKSSIDVRPLTIKCTALQCNDLYRKVIHYNVFYVAWLRSEKDCSIRPSLLYWWFMLYEINTSSHPLAGFHSFRVIQLNCQMLLSFGMEIIMTITKMFKKTCRVLVNVSLFTIDGGYNYEFCTLELQSKIPSFSRNFAPNYWEYKNFFPIKNVYKESTTPKFY